MPSLRASKKMSPSPSMSTVTELAAARPTRDATMRPPCVSTGATSTTEPPGARITPSAVIDPALPSDVRRNGPPTSASSPMSSVVATSPPTSICEPAPNTMPRGLERNTRPLAWICPSSTDGSPPTTRLSSTEVVDGCTICTRSPLPTENDCQLIAALSVPCTICV